MRRFYITTLCRIYAIAAAFCLRRHETHALAAGTWATRTEAFSDRAIELSREGL